MGYRLCLMASVCILGLACGGGSSSKSTPTPGGSAVTFTLQPQSQVVSANGVVSFTVAASGDPSPTFQWQRSEPGSSTWSALSGATTTTYSFTAQTQDSGAKFRAQASSGGNTVNSNAATLTVLSGQSLAGEFPFGVWLQSPTRTRGGKTNAENYRDIGITIFIGLWEWPSETNMGTGYDLPAAQALKDNGLKAIAGNDQSAVDWINAHPDFASTFTGYLLGDEADMNKVSGDPAVAAASMPDAWQSTGDAMRTADPTRERYANFGKGFALDPWVGYHINPGPTQADDFAKYIEPTTFISSDYYAITDPYEALEDHGIWGYGRAVTNTINNADGLPVWGFVEGSAPFPEGKVANNLAARMPANLIYSAIWEMVAHGANGVIYFCHDFSNGMIEDGLLNEPGMPEAVKAANASVTQYGSVLATATVAGTTAVTDGSVPVTVLTKHFNGFTYIFAMGDGNTNYPSGKAVTATISVSGAGSGSVHELQDGRTLTLTSGSFSDTFDPYQLHIYRF